MSRLPAMGTLLCLAAPSVLIAQVQDLGSPLGESARPIAISANGRVAIGATFQSSPAQALPFRFTDVVGFEVLPSLNGADAEPVDISDDGQFIAGNVSNSRAVRWTEAGAPLDLGSLGPFFTKANAMSGDGSTIVGQADSGGTYRHAFRWTEPGGMIDLHPSFSPGTSEAIAASFDGSIVVGYAVVPIAAGGLTNTSTVWSSVTGTIDIDDGTSDFSRAQDVSADGSVVVGIVRFGTGPLQPYVWTATAGLVPLGTIGVGSGITVGLSADGSTVFGSTGDVGFRWSQAGGLEQFTGNPHFVPRSASADGSVLAGLLSLSTSAIVGAATWTEATGVTTLPIPTGTNAAALGVTADGSAILGSLFPSSGGRRSIRWRSDGTIGSTYCDPAIPNSASSTGAGLTLGGSNRASDRDLALQVADLPPNSFGFFIASRVRDLVVMPGGSQGTLCLGASIGRFVGPGQILNSGTLGAFTLHIDPSTLPSPTGPVLPSFGETWHFQAWYRDANPGVTSNFSSAASVAIY